MSPEIGIHLQSRFKLLQLEMAILSGQQTQASRVLVWVVVIRSVMACISLMKRLEAPLWIAAGMFTGKCYSNCGNFNDLEIRVPSDTDFFFNLQRSGSNSFGPQTLQCSWLREEKMEGKNYTPHQHHEYTVCISVCVHHTADHHC